MPTVERDNFPDEKREGAPVLTDQGQVSNLREQIMNKGGRPATGGTT
jgi:hypothetical protein